jgi:hypothetical protein
LNHEGEGTSASFSEGLRIKVVENRAADEDEGSEDEEVEEEEGSDEGGGVLLSLFLVPIRCSSFIILDSSASVSVRGYNYSYM